MHAADFAAARQREIRERVEEVDQQILSGFCSDYTSYRQAVARRAALLEMADLMRDAMDRYEARS